MIGCGDRGFTDGPFSKAAFSNPQGVVYHHPDVVFVADTDNHAIRKVVTIFGDYDKVVFLS